MVTDGSMTGILPVAGQGTRMMPLTENMSKALVSVGGRSLLERGIGLLAELGVTDIIIITGSHGQSVRAEVTMLEPSLPIRFVEQPEPRGLVDALIRARESIEGDAVLLCPDNLFSDPADLVTSVQIFHERKPTILQVATFASDRRRGRTDFDLVQLESLRANAFRYRGSDAEGVPIRSTGVTFFSRDALFMIPKTSGPEEVTLASVLIDLREKVDFLVTLLRGARFDITAPEDITAWETLARQRVGRDRVGVSAVLRNHRGEVLMQLRDNNPEIRFPGTWGLFGGSVDKNESPEDAIVREIEEELGYRASHFGQIRCFVFEGKLEFAYLALVDASRDQLFLREGRDFGFFTPDQLKTMPIRPDDRLTLADYFGWEAD